MMNIVKFLEMKPVINKVDDKLVFSTFSQIEGLDTNYEVITMDLTEAKAFKDYTRLEKVDNTIKAYKGNQLKDHFVINLDNSVYKIIDSNHKIDIINIEKDQFDLENIKAYKELEDVEFEEPYVATIPCEKDSFFKKIIKKFSK